MKLIGGNLEVKGKWWGEEKSTYKSALNVNDVMYSKKRGDSNTYEANNKINTMLSLPTDVLVHLTKASYK